MAGHRQRRTGGGARGPIRGEPWPEGMLGWEPGQIGSLRCPIISPLAQIEIKEVMPVWPPGFQRRPKDAQDIVRLRAALRDRGRFSSWLVMLMSRV